MRNKILKSILAAAGVVLVASLLLITGVLYQYFGNIQQSQLKDELSLAAQGVEKSGEEYLTDLPEESYRLTLIGEGGTVYYDTQVDAAKMENHADREEVKEAIATGTGSSSRYSVTLTEKYLYEAVRLSDGSVLRASESRATAVVLILGMLQPIVFLIIIVIIFSYWLASRMAKQVVEPLYQLNLDEPLENDVYEELSPLLHRIYAQQVEIQGQMHVLSRKQDEFDQITENVREALILLDNKDRIVSINPAGRRLFHADHVIGEDFLTIEHKKSMIKALEEAKKSGFAMLREKREGRQYQFEISRIESGNKAHGIMVFGYDITEQLNAEKVRREFTANVSHELKTPLQAIIGSAELLENGIVKQEDTPRFIGHIRTEAARLLTLIDDIIRLSQLDEGADMPKETVSMFSLATEVMENLSDAAERKNVTVEVVGDDGDMQGVRRLLYEVCYNLCDNAIKYNQPEGSVKMEIKELPDAVRLQVTDTGIGIAEGEQEKIFERFYRVDKSHSKQSGGTGLGLSIVKHAVQYHHGSIDVDSAPGEGTQITIQFPKS